MRNPKYQKNKKNGGIIPPIYDNRTLRVPITCGKCIECRTEKRNSWIVRLTEDIKTNTNGHMVTLTFSNEAITELINKYEHIKQAKGYDKDNAIAITALRKFNENWRKHNGKALRHWLVTELGHHGTENIHLHGIIWTDKIQDLKKLWKYGFVWDGYTKNGIRENYVNGQTVSYTTKYIQKTDIRHPLYNPKVLTSPGIGKAYLNQKTFKYPYCEQWTTRDKNGNWKVKTYIKYIKETKQGIGNWQLNQYKGTQTNQGYKTETGHTIALPKYYKNHIYTEEQREQLWMDKLDKNEKWVMGQKVDTSNPINEYHALIKQARYINRKLGYGSNYKSQEQDNYENNRREELYKIRTNTASGGVLTQDFGLVRATPAQHTIRTPKRVQIHKTKKYYYTLIQQRMWITWWEQFKKNLEIQSK